jgi:hypothetical protein
MESDIPRKKNLNVAGVATLKSGKADFKLKVVRRDKILIMRIIHREEIMIVSICTKCWYTQYHKTKSTGRKGTDRSKSYNSKWLQHPILTSR